MLTTVLHGDTADKQTIFIMRTFREMRRFIASNAYMFDRISSVELRQIEYEKKTDTKLGQIFDYISDHEESTQKVFFDGHEAVYPFTGQQFHIPASTHCMR